MISQKFIDGVIKSGTWNHETLAKFVVDQDRESLIILLGEIEGNEIDDDKVLAAKILQSQHIPLENLRIIVAIKFAIEVENRKKK